MNDRTQDTPEDPDISKPYWPVPDLSHVEEAPDSPFAEPSPRLPPADQDEPAEADTEGDGAE